MTHLKHLYRIALLVMVFALASFAYYRYFFWWLVEDSGLVRLSMIWGALLLAGPLFYFLVIGILSWRYREVPPVADERLPILTVVVPAYNEGKHIFSSLQSLLASDYPAEKLEIFAIDDGSIDDTWSWMQRAANLAPGRIHLLKCPQNQGKRNALYQGFSAAKGDVFISVDSDSTVRPDALRLMVSPFVDDPRVGAVSGNVRVMNLNNGIFPPMVDVGFTFSFEFIRIGQSVMGGVFCTPGALSAYRREAVMPVLDGWLNQRFMGRPAGIGEDRAMTNLILSQNYRVQIQRSALVETNVPETYRGMSKMLLRWERSNIRENLAMYRFIFRIFNFSSLRSWFLLFSLLLYTQVALTPVVMIWITLYNVVATEGAILGSIVLMVLLWGTLPAMINLRRRSTKLMCFCYFYGIFHALTLFWVVPYAFLTVGNSKWLTRMTPGANGKI